MGPEISLHLIILTARLNTNALQDIISGMYPHALASDFFQGF